jgi:hypothetical protein
MDVFCQWTRGQLTIRYCAVKDCRTSIEDLDLGAEDCSEYAAQRSLRTTIHRTTDTVLRRLLWARNWLFIESSFE